VADDVTWLILIYKVPSEPTRLRATVWRRIKSLGAVYLQNGCAALPASATSERALRSLRSEIRDLGGDAQLLHASVLAGQTEVVAAFNAARDEEYAEIASRGADFEAEIEREVAQRHLTYAELEENDEDLAKLKSWFAKVQARDVLGATGARVASEALARCELALEQFATLVYEAEGAG
jgi:hypothetical protein